MKRNFKIEFICYFIMLIIAEILAFEFTPAGIVIILGTIIMGILCTKNSRK